MGWWIFRDSVFDVPSVVVVVIVVVGIGVVVVHGCTGKLGAKK